MTQSQLPANLKRVAISWAGQITKLAKSFAPVHLRPYIHSKTETKDNGKFIIRTTVNRRENPLPKYGSADARAQEYGSGLRAQKGTKKKYPIDGKPWLAFAVINNKGNAFAAFDPNTRKGIGDKNVVITSHVDHPGIHAANNGQGYIRPAVKEIRLRGKAELTREVRAAILGDLRQSFGRKAK